MAGSLICGMLQVFATVCREHRAVLHVSLSLPGRLKKLQGREMPEMPVGCSVWVFRVGLSDLHRR